MLRYALAAIRDCRQGGDTQRCSHYFSVDSRADNAVSARAGDVSADTSGRYA